MGDEDHLEENPPKHFTTQQIPFTGQLIVVILLKSQGWLQGRFMFSKMSSTRNSSFFS
jgi:hypothetical protein